MKKIITLLCMLFFVTVSYSQTYVSGGIYSNTTWTQANSPYIVMDTVVVFPGVTLTIQSGVTVKFANNKRLEIRQAKLIALGTITDSIMFMSNSGSPVPGSWNSIFINNYGIDKSYAIFDFCNFKHAKYGIFGAYHSDSVIVKNSTFKYNQYGIYADSWGMTRSSIDSCKISNNTNHGLYLWWNVVVDHCIISNNPNGAYLRQECTLKNSIVENNSGYGIYFYAIADSVTNNHIQYNGIGIYDKDGGYYETITRNIIEYNGIGIKLENYFSKISCNKICNNTTYNLYYNVVFGGNSAYLTYNNWCLTDSTMIASKIYDGYDNINLGLVTFMPIDTTQCYLSGCNLHVNATVTNATCDTCHNGSATAHVTYGIPPYTYTWYTSPLQTTQTATGLAPGTYTVCVADAMGCSACNHNVFVDSTNCTGFSIAAHGQNTTCSSCNDGQAWVSTTGGTPPFIYTWYTNPMQSTAAVNNLLPGAYGVCVSDVYGCVSCDSVSISTGNCSAHFNLYPDNIVLHQYYAVNMASGVQPLSYLWQWGDGTTSTGPFPTHTYTTAGMYAICLSITDAVGCTNTYCNNYYLQKSTNTMVTITVIPDATTGVNVDVADHAVDIFPNPSSGLINITFAETTKESRIEVLNSCGQVILTKEVINAANTTLDLTNHAKGLYFIKVRSGNGVVVRKVVME